MSTLLIRNGRVIDPARYLDEVRDVWIVDGRFAPEGLQPARADETLDATGLLVMPGLVDVHVHLREPGNEAAETLETGCAAALAGGYTSIICMPNTTPALDTPERLRAVLSKAAALRGPHVYALAAITVGRQGKGAGGLRRAQGGRRARLHRRRERRAGCGPDPFGDGAVRGAGRAHRGALRGRVARRRRRDAPRRGFRAREAARNSGRGGIGDGRARRAPLRADRRGAPPPAHQQRAWR